jgi:hypothetical protein
MPINKWFFQIAKESEKVNVDFGSGGIVFCTFNYHFHLVRVLMAPGYITHWHTASGPATNSGFATSSPDDHGSWKFDCSTNGQNIEESPEKLPLILESSRVHWKWRLRFSFTRGRGVGSQKSHIDLQLQSLSRKKKYVMRGGVDPKKKQ